MRGFFRFSIVYLAAAILLVQLVRGDGLPSAIGAMQAAAGSMPIAGNLHLATLAIVMAGLLFWSRPGLRGIAPGLVLAVLGTICFLSAFALIKALLPDIQPFYADRLLADADEWLHGGLVPWRVLHNWFPQLPSEIAHLAYFRIWVALAFLFPVALALQDRDTARVRRFLVLYGVAWFGLGNLGALAAMSSGPVYYDRLHDTERFVDLTAAIHAGALGSPFLRFIQDSLWTFYVDGTQVLGTGISAFPSVHVAVACVVMLYVLERLPWLAPAAAAYLAAIQFLSVYTGYHYAIDGYFSILVIVSAWVLLRRTANAAQNGAVPVPAH